jgi:uncharacterized protein (DUF2267 family)
MNYETFEQAVSERAGVPRDRATVLIRAVLETLSERLTGGEADDLAAQLPEPAKRWLATPVEPAESFGLDEFIRRVEKRAKVPPEEAREGTQAVFATLREAVTGGEFKNTMSQLPREFSGLVGS